MKHAHTRAILLFMIAALVATGIAFEGPSRTQSAYGGNTIASCGGVAAGYQEISSYPILLNQSDVRRSISRGMPLWIRVAGTRSVIRARILVTSEGSVDSLEVSHDPKGAPLARAVQEAAGRMKFEPAYYGRGTVHVDRGADPVSILALARVPRADVPALPVKGGIPCRLAERS
jgi:hypothetical protein